jgi:hypothetical protein
LRIELDLALAGIGLDAFEPFQEIVIPRGPAKLAVGHGLEPRLLLLADHAVDLAILDRGEGCRGDFAARAFLPRPSERSRPADAIGAKRRFIIRHP